MGAFSHKTGNGIMIEAYEIAGIDVQGLRESITDPSIVKGLPDAA